MNKRAVYMIGLVGLLMASLGGGWVRGQAGDESVGEGGAAATESAGRKVFVLPITGMISDVTLNGLKRRVAEARERGADLIVLEMDTPGGLVTSALDICTYLKQLDIETLAWVNPDAYSAGAMISVACDNIVMAERSAMGDAAPIAMGQSLDETERAKIESPILEEFRDSARRNGYPVILTQAMVRLGPAIYMIERTDGDERRFVYADELSAFEGESGEPLRPKGGARDRRSDGNRDAAGPSRRDGTDSGDGGSPGSAEDVVRRLFGVDGPGSPDETPGSPGSREDGANGAGGDAGRSDGEDSGGGPRPLADVSGQWRVVEEANPADTLLTLSQTEAVRYGFAQQIVGDDAELAAFTGDADGEVVRLVSTWSEELAKTLTSPAVRSVLMILLLLGAYMELQSPGVGLPGGVAVAALVVLIGAPYLAGLAGAMDLIIIALGVALILVEIFVLPGFGLPGAMGMLALFVGLLLTFIQREPGPGWVPQLPQTWDQFQAGVIALMSALAVSMVGMYFLTRYFGHIPMLNKLVLQNAQAPHQPGLHPAAAGAGPAVAEDEEPAGPYPVRAGDTGRAMTQLRPVGRAEFDGRIIDVVTPGGWVEADRPVRVVEVRGNRVVVEEA